MLMRTAVNLRAAVNNLKHNVMRTEPVFRDNSSPVAPYLPSVVILHEYRRSVWKRLFYFIYYSLLINFAETEISRFVLNYQSAKKIFIHRYIYYGIYITELIKYK